MLLMLLADSAPGTCMHMYVRLLFKHVLLPILPGGVCHCMSHGHVAASIRGQIYMPAPHQPELVDTAMAVVT